MSLLIEELKKEVFRHRPVLGEIAEKYGAVPLKDYVRNRWEVPSAAPDELFLQILGQETEKIYGKDYAEKVTTQLAAKPLISTVDHLGIWNHPFFVNSDLIYSLHFNSEELPVVLATESVSLNNTSSWSASLLWHDLEGKIERHSFLPNKVKTLPVFSAPAIKEADINRFQAATKGKLDSLVKILDLENPSTDSFSTQACRSSHKLWKSVFPSAPKLVY